MANSGTAAFDYGDRRKHERISVETVIYVEIARRGNRSEAHNTIIRCETVDISVGGLRIWVPELIAQGSKLNLAVPMEGWTENLELVGSAMWVRPADNADGYWVGLALEDSSHEDMAKWCKVVRSLQK